jgi:hypothetical protein
VRTGISPDDSGACSRECVAHATGDFSVVRRTQTTVSRLSHLIARCRGGHIEVRATYATPAIALARATGGRQLMFGKKEGVPHALLAPFENPNQDSVEQVTAFILDSLGRR